MTHQMTQGAMAGMAAGLASGGSVASEEVRVVLAAVRHNTGIPDICKSCSD